MERHEQATGTRENANDRPDDDAAETRDGGRTSSQERESGTLFPPEESSDFGRRWEEIQTTFVDEPQRAVEEADALVASVMERLTDGFARERERLEGQWSRGEDASTEDLRITLQRYRSFFRRLLSV
jgi:hypothetical protein